MVPVSVITGNDDCRPDTVSRPSRRMRLGLLPRDMREELFNEHATNLNPDATEQGFYAKTVPYGLMYITGLTVARIPEEQLSRYMEANLADLPPIVISDGRFIDGQHRVLTAIARGATQLRYIDVTGLIDTDAGGYVCEIPLKYDPVSAKQRSAKPRQLDAGHDFKTDAGSFTSYFWNGDKKQGEVTVEKEKTGYIIRNIALPDDEQRHGVGTAIYAWVNELSIRDTAKPMQSTRPRTLLSGQTVFELSDAAKGLWDSLVREGSAEKHANGAYNCKSENEPEAKEKVKSGRKVKP